MSKLCFLAAVSSFSELDKDFPGSKSMGPSQLFVKRRQQMFGDPKELSWLDHLSGCWLSSGSDPQSF